MSPEKCCPKLFHYRRVWLALLIITTIMAVLTLGFSSLAVHMPSPKPSTQAGNVYGSDAPRKSSNAIPKLTDRIALPALKTATSTAGSPIAIDSASNMVLEALPAPMSMAAPPMPPPKANLDQIRNGTAAAPINPPNWVNGNAGASQAHYNEGHSIPYRVVFTDLAIGAHFIDVEWDIRQSSKNALDYITHFQRLSPHIFIPAHPAETVDPTIGVSGLAAPNVFAIPAPNQSAPSVATTSFNALPAAQRNMTIYNGSITALSYLSEGSLAAASSSTRMRINFTASSPTVVLAWGGHIAASSDWGPGSSASAVSGSPYHTRLISLDGASTGQQDRSLAAAAVFIPPDCSITGLAEVCPSSTNSYSGPSGAFTYLWTITSGSATISGSNTGQTVNVVANASCGSYTLELKLTRTADNGMTTCTKTVNVVDTTNPTVTFDPPDATIACPAVPVFGTPTFSDNCDGNLTVTSSDSSVAGCSSNTGMFTRTWTATDDCGNSVQTSQTITVVDTTAPLINGVGGPQTIECPNTPAFSSPTASDACDSTPTLTFNDVRTEGSCANEYSVTRTWTATDDCGNTNTASQTITVQDTTAPTIGSPGADATIECPTEPTFTPPTATDACDSTPVEIIEVSDETSPGACDGSYARTKTWKARDCAGNESSTVSQTITVSDTTAPSIGSPGADATIECPASPDFTPPEATDACDASPQIIEVSDQTTPTDCPGVYSRTKTWKARDCSGNESGTVSQTITVDDTTPPTITSCPTDVTVTCLDDVAELGDFYALGGEASDGCGSVIVTYSDSAPFDTNSCGADCGGKITRTYTVTDCVGLVDTCTQVITFGTPASAQEQLVADLLKSGDLVVGEPGVRSLTIPGGPAAKASAFCLVSKLSSGGLGSTLPDFGDKRLDPATCQTSPSLELQKDGTWRNVALSQAVSLALNLRLSGQQEKLREQAKMSGIAAVLQVGRPDADFDLGSYKLTAVLSTQGAMPGLDGLRGTFDDELDVSSARTQLTIPASVLMALGPNATAADLLRLANLELAGVTTSEARLADIAAALDAVNRSFDFGKRRLILNANVPAK